MKKKKGIIQEFREFIARGNVIDLAVGVIIGSAFTAIVNSLVDDLVMPLIGMIIGRTSFENFKIILSPAVGDTAESAIYYGRFIQNVVNFFLIALVVFIMVKLINSLYKKQEDTPPTPAAPTDLEVNNALLQEHIAVLKDIQEELKRQNNSTIVSKEKSR